MATPNLPDEFGSEESEEEPLDLTLYFEDLGPGEPSTGWPEDWIGPEIQTVLRTVEKGRRAGKSYRPDPSGQRRAIKDANYRAGTQFFATHHLIENLDDLYWLLLKLAADRTAFLSGGCWRNGREPRDGSRRQANTATKRFAGSSAFMATAAPWRGCHASSL